MCQDFYIVCFGLDVEKNWAHCTAWQHALCIDERRCYFFMAEVRAGIIG